MKSPASTIDEVLKYRPQFCFKAVAALGDSHGGDEEVIFQGLWPELNVQS